MPTLHDLARWLERRLDESRPLWRPGPERVRRLALALDPDDLPAHLHADALFLHRAHRLGNRHPQVGVLAAHDGFDTHLTTGENRPLANALHWRDPQRITDRGRTYGLSATPPETTMPDLLRAITHELGGVEATVAVQTPRRVALMNAMRPELLDLVGAQGVNVYITGQLRPGAVPRARELGIGVIALGHRRSEHWGLRQLARELQEAFAELHTHVHGLPE